MNRITLTLIYMKSSKWQPSKPAGKAYVLPTPTAYHQKIKKLEGIPTPWIDGLRKPPPWNLLVTLLNCQVPNEAMTRL